MMNKFWVLSPIIRIGLFLLILSLGLLAIASQVEPLAVADRLNALAQAIDNLPQGMEVRVWQPSIFEMLGGVAFIVLMVLALRFYLLHFKPRSLHQARYFWLLVLLLLLFAGTAWAMVGQPKILAYLFPMATLSVMLAVLFDAHLSVLVTALMGLSLGYLAGGSVELTVYAMIGGLMGALSMGQRKHLGRLLWSGTYVALSNVIVLLVFHISNGHSTDLFKLMAVGIANGVIAATLTLIGFFLVGNLLGIVTSVQLLELTQPTHPLLRQLVLQAPGTYHHSLLVSNLAEQAAERIGAEALLTRVGAYYHDIGKLRHPHLFIENQIYAPNTHDQLDPHSSAQAIIDHVEHGLKLAKKYRLPGAVQVFIAEHHGTSLVEYFYQQALEQAAELTQVDEIDFRYPGPKPQSKETALVMLADSCEAATRATKPASMEALEQLVHHIIIHKVSRGQLDECDLTLHELELIHNTFVEMLQGALHQRVEYPQEADEEDGNPTPAMSSAPTQPPLVTTPSP